MKRFLSLTLVTLLALPLLAAQPELLPADALSPKVTDIQEKYQAQEGALQEKLQSLAEGKDSEALHALAILETDEKQALAYLLQAASLDNPAAQYQIAMAYLTGNGAPQNDIQAVAWLKKAAILKNVEAAYNLGTIYHTGHFGMPDSGEALRWYKHAADLGYAPAQYQLGVIFSNKEGMNYDLTQAQQYLTLAAAQDHEKAKALLKEISAKP